MKTIFLGTFVLFPCLLVFNESEYFIFNLLGLIYIGLLFLLVNKSIRFRQFFIDFYNMVEYYNNKIFK